MRYRSGLTSGQIVKRIRTYDKMGRLCGFEQPRGFYRCVETAGKLSLETTYKTERTLLPEFEDHGRRISETEGNAARLQYRSSQAVTESLHNVTDLSDEQLAVTPRHQVDTILLCCRLSEHSNVPGH